MDALVIPDFKTTKERNQWIRENSQYWTVIRRHQRRYEREEYYSFDEAVDRAKIIVSRAPDARLLIYAVAAGHDTLAATVSSGGIKEHE